MTEYSESEDCPNNAYLYGVDRETVGTELEAQLEIKTWPTFIFFYQGQEVKRFTGSDEARLFDLIDKASKTIIQNSKSVTGPAIDTRVFEEELSLILKKDQGITIPQMLQKLYESDPTGDL